MFYLLIGIVMPFRLMTRSVSVSLKIAAGRTIFVTDAHRDDGKRFVVHADEKLTAFLELERAIRASNGHDDGAVSV